MLQSAVEPYFLADVTSKSVITNQAIRAQTIFTDSLMVTYF